MLEKTVEIAGLHHCCKLTPARCANFAEAACVCLEKLGHLPGVKMMVRGDGEGKVVLQWKKLGTTVFDSWVNLEEAVEDAAYGLALALIWELSEYQIVKQSNKGSGIDFWLGKKEEGYPFQDKAKLEVSGILRGTMGQINARVKQKMAQATASDGGGQQVFVIVAEFSRPFSKIVQ